MKLPKFLSKRPAFLAKPPKKTYRATARRAAPAGLDDYDEEEPKTKLSSAFVVVLILHVVAVAGIYAFNSIKANRRTRETPASIVATKPAAPANTATPASQNPAESRPATPATAQLPSSTSPNAKTHQVRAGENPTRIAALYNVPVSNLQEVNHLKDNAMLVPGQVLTIPAKTPPKIAMNDTLKAVVPPKTEGASGGKTYVVKKGDTAVSIARAQSLSSDELLRFNKISDPKKLQLGQTLKLPPKKD